MDIEITALELTEALEYVNEEMMVRRSYEYNEKHYLPMNLEGELIERGIEFIIVTYTVVYDEEDGL